MERTARGRAVRLPVALAAAIVAVSAVLSFVQTPTTEATSIVPFAPTFTTNDNGSIAVFGNNLMTCPAAVADCAATRAGSTNKNNNGYDMVHLDVDGAAYPTYSSSTAEVVLPPDSEVRWAGLYWGARLGTGARGAPAIGDGTQMKLRAPGDADYRTITATRPLFGPSATSDRAYQAFADVTSIVQQTGPGAFTGADVPAGTGEDRYAGWSLVVVYRSPSLPLRNLTVFDGLADVGQGDPQTITISGFRTPVTGPVNVRLGMVAYEGDRGSSGDRAVLEGTQLATSLSQGTNFFNSTNDDNGTLVTSRNPADRNMLGFDIKNFDAPGILANSATSARIDLASTSERYFPGVVTTAIDVFAPDFSPSTKTVSNLSGGNPARVGERLRYSVTFTNAGQDPAVDTSISDPIPPVTTYVPGSLVLPAGVTGTFDSGSNSVEVSPGDFPVGRSMTFTFDVDVLSAAGGTNVANRATITYDGATLTELQDLTFSTRAATIPVIASSDLSITKSNDPSTVTAGNEVVSTIVVSNAGPNAATDVVVVDQLPGGAGSVTADAPGPCIVNSVLLSCQLGTLAVGSTATIVVRTPIPADSPLLSVTDVATVSSSTSDTDSSNNVSSASSDVSRNADLSITKTASPTTVTPGGNVTFTITVANAGPSTATDIAITDLAIDPEVVFVGASTPAGSCPFVATGARCTIPSIPPDGTVVMTVNGVVAPSTPAGTQLVDTANVTSATPDEGPGPNTVTTSITTGPVVSNLTITKTASAPVPLIAGSGQVRYTIDVVNTGPSRADPVTVDDVLPPGFVVVSTTTDRGTCLTTPAPTGAAVDCDLGSLTAPFLGAPGARARITIVAEVPADIAPGTYVNSATVRAPGASPATSAPAPVTVDAQANLTVVKSLPEGASNPVLGLGSTLAYRIRVTNAGPSVAANAFVSDVLPPGLSTLGATPLTIRSINGNTVGPFPECEPTRCELGEIGPDTTIELELEVRVDALPVDPTAGFANRADVGSDTADPNDSDNSSTFTVAGPPQADVGIRKFAPGPDRDPFPVPLPVAGLNTSYVLEVVNYGPSPAPDFVFTDVLPPDVRFVRAFEPLLPPTDLNFAYPDLCTGDGLNPETVTCDFRDVVGAPPGFEFPAYVGTRVGIEVSIPATVPDGTVLTNLSSISTSVLDGNFGNNSSTATVAVRAVTNLRIDKLVIALDASGDIVGEVDPLDDPLVVPPGNAVSFGLVVTNEGPSAATDVQVFDAFPIEGGNFPIGACEFLNGETVCRYTDNGGVLLPVDPLVPGSGVFGTQLISLPDPDTPPDVYINTARVSTTTTETDYGDNLDARSIRVDDPVADLIIEKAATTSPFVAGGTFSYQIAARAGRIDITAPPLRLSSNADDVVVTDTLPAGLVPTSATSSQGTCSIAGQVVTCQLGTLRPAVTLEPVTPALVTISGTVAAGVPGAAVVNTAVGTTSTNVAVGADLTSTVATPLVRSADLSITKTASSTTVAAGDGVSFTINVTNNGPSDATGVVVTDLVPSPLVFVSSSLGPACDDAAGAVECTVGTIASGETVTIEVTADVPSDAPAGAITNSASVVATTPDPDDADNSATAGVAVVQAADLSVTKSASAEGVLLGGSVLYTLTIANAGPSNAIATVLTESIPPGTTVATLPTGCVDGGGGTITCVLGDLAAGDATTLELELTVPDALQPGPLDNTASVASDTDDPEPDNDSDTVTVEAVAQADVTLTKTLLTTDPVAGQPVEYLLTLVNHGPTVAPNASLSDPIPVGTTYVSFTPSQGECQLDEVEDVPSASCSFGRIDVDGIATATLVVLTDPNATSITNTAYSGSGGLDGAPADNEDTATAALALVADVAVTVTAEQDAVAAGTNVSYRVDVTNNGPRAAVAATLTATIPSAILDAPADVAAALDVPDDSAFATAPDSPWMAAADSVFAAARLVVPPECTTVGVTAACALGDLAAGATRSLSFSGTVRAGTPPGTQLPLLATVAFVGIDSVTANNADSDTILVIETQTPVPPSTIPPATIPPATIPPATIPPVTIPPAPPPPPESSPPPRGGLPVTGTTVALVLAFGAALCLAGGVLLGGTRRRPLVNAWRRGPARR